MSITSTPPSLTLEAWEAFTAAHEQRHELVRGVPVVAPTESNLNRLTVAVLCTLLNDAFGDRWRALPGVEVHLGCLGESGHDTVRVPDVVLVRRGVDPRAHRDAAADCALVVEVVSPSSVETDWIVKREEYAAAGIPAYLVVDPRGDHPRMALFDRLVGGRYADPHPDGTRCTITVERTSVEVRLDDLLTW